MSQLCLNIKSLLNLEKIFFLHIYTEFFSKVYPKGEIISIAIVIIICTW